MNNTLYRLAHRLRLANNLGLEDDIVPIALKIAEEVLRLVEKETEEAKCLNKVTE